jgi:hypothetical protein
MARGFEILRHGLHPQLRRGQQVFGDAAAGATLVEIDHRDGQLGGHLVLVGGGVVEAVEEARQHENHQGRARVQHRPEGVGRTRQDGVEHGHDATPADGFDVPTAGRGTLASSAAASKNMPSATPDMKPSGASDTAAGAPMNICSIWSWT